MRPSQPALHVTVQHQRRPHKVVFHLSTLVSTHSINSLSNPGLQSPGVSTTLVVVTQHQPSPRSTSRLMSSSVSGPLTIHSPQEWLEMAKRSAVLSWNRPILAPTFSPDRPHLPQPIQHWTPSTAIAPGPLNPTVAAPARPNAAVQWTPLHGGASSPFMPVFISPFAMLGQPMNPSAAHDDTTQTQAQHPHNDLTDLVNLPNRQKRGRALEIEGRVKKLKSKDDLGSDHAVTLCRYPPERTLRVSGIQSNATKEELVFFFRGCPMYASMLPTYFYPDRNPLLTISLETRSITIPAKQVHAAMQ